MNPETLVVIVFVIVIGVVVVESLKSYRDNRRLSPTRDKNKPVDLPQPDDGRSGPVDASGVGPEASCGGDAGGD